MIETANTLTQSRMQKAVMRRVRVIRAVRPFISNLAGALYLLTVSLYLLGREVFVAQVWRNMPSLADVGAVVRFLEGAFLGTTVNVQIITLLIGISFLWMGYESARRLIPSQVQFA